MESYKKIIVELRSNLLKLQKESKEKSQETETIRSKLKKAQLELETTITESKTYITKYSKIIKELQSNLESKSQETETVRSELSNARSELASVRSELSTARAELVSVRTESEASETRHKKTIENLRENLESKSQEIATVISDLTTVKAELENTRTELESVRTNLEDAQSASEASELRYNQDRTQLRNSIVTLNKTITQHKMIIGNLKKKNVKCLANKAGSKWLSKYRKTNLDKTNIALDAKSRELDAKSRELEEVKSKLETKTQSYSKFIEAMRLYDTEDKNEEDKYTVGELWRKYEGKLQCNRLTIREKIIYNILAKRYNEQNPSYSQYKQLTDPLTIADIAYVEKLKEQRKQCVKFLALNGENGCLERIEELQDELQDCKIKSTYNSDFDESSDESSDDSDNVSNLARRKHLRTPTKNPASKRHYKKKNGVEYREFDVEGRGRIRVKYIKNPINSKGKPTVQGRGGYYYGVTDDGEKVTVRGKYNVHTVRDRTANRYATSVSAAARRSQFSENRSKHTFVVNTNNIIKKKLIF